MNVCDIFIRRPVMTTLVMISILIFGFMSYQRLAVSDLPNVDFPTIVVSANLPGASAETMAASVATPLEKQLSTIAGIDSMSSTSFLGASSITLTFDLSRNIDAAAQDVQTAIARTASRLPKDLPYPPSFRKVNPADQPILLLALTSPTLPLYQLNEYGEDLIAQRVSMVGGVAQVMVYGSQKYAVRIQVDPTALASRGLGLDEVSRAIQSANANLPTGLLQGPHQGFTVTATGQLTEAKDYRPVIVAYREGQPVRVEDIGDSIDSVENNRQAAWYINQRSIVLAVQRQPGTNTVEVARAVRELLPTFRAQMPASVSLELLFDRSDSIRESVQDVKFTLVFTLGLVVLVIFIFLRHLSATLIPSLAMPLSVLGTFVVMYLLGYSLDNLSLMALILAVGFVVDDAIVMLENIVRHLEMGEDPMTAALNGSREINFTIISMTLSLAAVFIPVLFMGGIVGRLFEEFAVCIGVAVLVSGVISLTLTPMMCSRFLRANHERKPNRLYLWSERAFNALAHAYGRGLKWVLGHRLIVLVFTAAIMAATVYLFQIMPKGFIPSEDTGQLIANTEAAEGVSFAYMVEHQRAVAAIFAADPNVQAFMSNCGARGSFSRGNSGSLFVRLKPRKDRALSADQVVQQLRQKAAQVPGMRTFVQNPPVLRMGGMATKSTYQFTLQSPDTAELYRLAPLVADKIRALPDLVDVTTDLALNSPQVTVAIDRDKATLLGVSAERIEDALYSAYGSRQISTIYAPNNDFAVILEVKPEYQRQMADLSQLYVRANSGQLIPLDSVAKMTRNLGPAAVNHLGQLPAVTVSFNLRPGAALGQAVGAVQKIARETLPGTISTSFQGTAQAFQSSFKGMGLLLVVAILVIYIVLGILYESFIHPITILTALPFAGFGALFTLLAFGTELNIYAFVGIVMLVGLVKKNGIIMIDFAIEARQKRDLSAPEAIHEACLVRFRPIMMTTMAALVGTLPIALGYGAGGESRQPLGLAVVGGLLFSQMLTLFVTPVFYVYFDRLQEWLGRRKRKVVVAAA